MALMEAVNASGTAYLSHTKVEGRAALRLGDGFLAHDRGRHRPDLGRRW